MTPLDETKTRAAYCSWAWGEQHCIDDETLRLSIEYKVRALNGYGLDYLLEEARKRPALRAYLVEARLAGLR